MKRWKLTWVSEDSVFALKTTNIIDLAQTKEVTLTVKPGKTGITLYFQNWSTANEARRQLMGMLKDLGFKQMTKGYSNHLTVAVKKMEYTFLFSCANNADAFEGWTNGRMNCFYFNGEGEVMNADQYSKSVYL